MSGTSPFYNILMRENSKLPTSTAREQNIADLASGKARAVLTGQQVGLFLGPAFTLYKALSAIEIAKSLEKESGERFVPIFWLQTEDHDLAEISSIQIATRSGKPEKISLPLDSVENRTSVDHLKLGPGINECFAKLAKELGSYPEAAFALSILEKHYQAEQSYAEAFAASLAEIFAEDGLIFFNPRWEGVAEFAAPVFQRALSEYDRIARVLSEHSSNLSDQKYQTPVRIRANSPLFFVHPEGATGPRYRIERDGEAWLYVGAGETLGKRELEELVLDKPEQLSTSALLRPILQDTLFPTEAYVGGPAELNYFRQLSVLYEIFDLEAPKILPRGSFLCIEQKTKAKLQELGLKLEDLELSESDLMEKAIEKGDLKLKSPQQLKEEVGEKFEAGFKLLHDAFAGVDPNQLKSVSKARDKVERIVESTAERYGSILLNKHEQLGEKIGSLQSFVFPAGSSQERFYGAAMFLCRYGRSFLPAIRARLPEFSADTVEVEL